MAPRVENPPPSFTLSALVQELSATYPEQVAIAYGSERVTFAHLYERSLRTATWLESSGVHAGDRVGFVSANGPWFFEIAVACSHLNSVLVGVNWRLSPQEVADVLDDAGASCLISTPALASLVEPVLAVRTMTELRLDDAWDARILTTSPARFADRSGPASVILQLYSSGTTGRPKGVLITNAGLAFTRETGRRLYGMDVSSVNLLLSPLFHIGGAGYGLSAFSQGGTTVLLPDTRPERVLAAIEEHRVTHFFAVPTVIQSLLDCSSFSKTDVSSLRLVAYGGAPMSGSLLGRAMSQLKCEFMAVYGLTETTGTVTALLPSDHDPGGPRERLLGSIGRPLPWIGEIDVRDPATCETVGVDEVGEIWVRSGQVTPGYWNQPVETARSITPEGWFRTGDAASRDAEGYLFLRDRLKEMIISGGENIFPAEIENVLSVHPAVQEVAAIGIPSEKWGEEVRAMVVVRPGMTTTEVELIAFARARLAAYKCPKSVGFLDELPHNASGKLLRRAVREPFWTAPATS
jgi:long-chain acyl-CoA synthetase